MREIQQYLQDIYAVEMSPDLISAVKDAVMAEVTAWQARPLEPMYPVVFFDALRVKIRDEGIVRNKAVYLALAVLPSRHLGRLDRADRARLRKISVRWTLPMFEWKPALRVFAIAFGDRFLRPET